MSATSRRLGRDREGRPRATRTASLRRLLPVLFTAALLIPVQGVSAAAQDNSGTIAVGNTMSYGNTAYTITYSYPSTVDVGTNLTIVATLHVDSLSGLVEYLLLYRLAAVVLVGQHALNASVTPASGAPPFLYPGTTWRPASNITIPLTADNTGLAKGASANASVTITLQDTVFVAGVYKQPIAEPPMQGGAGEVVVRNSVAPPAQTQSYLPYALLASGAVLMAAAVFLPRSGRPPQGTQK